MFHLKTSSGLLIKHELAIIRLIITLSLVKRVAIEIKTTVALMFGQK